MTGLVRRSMRWRRAADEAGISWASSLDLEALCWGLLGLLGDSVGEFSAFNLPGLHYPNTR